MRAQVAGVVRWTAAHRGWAAVTALSLAGIVALTAASHGETSLGILKLRVGARADQTRVIIELDRATTGKVLTDRAAPSRVELALSRVAAAGPTRGQGAGLVRSWSVTEVGGAARIRFELTQPASVRRRFLLPPGDGSSVYRYVIDFAQSDDAVQSAASSPGPRGWRVRDLFRAGLPAQPPKVIVIDAGHGGKDPGAAGVATREKDVTLAAARRLAERLRRSGRYQVVLTRDTDRYLPLTERVQTARRANADLFLSLHADSDPDRSVRGAAAYTLSDRGTKLVASRVFEQADWFIDMNLPGQDRQVNRILLDLTQRRTKDRSGAFAEVLLQHVGDRVQLMRRSHRGAGFVVLLAPDVPAVLLEMGFITNAEDERQLADPAGRERLIDGVAQAVDAYFHPTTRVAAR